jgi:hypothetical protein
VSSVENSNEIDPNNMSDTPHISNKAETRARFVIASEAKQSNALSGLSELLRCSAPRNDGNMLTFAANSKGLMQ